MEFDGNKETFLATESRNKTDILTWKLEASIGQDQT